jgi:adenylate cyclase
VPKFLHKKPRSVRDVLEDLGLPPETIEKAEQAGTSELLAIDGVVLPERGKLTIEELAAKVGVEVEVVRVFWRALGFVDPIDGELAFNKRDVTILKSLFELTNEELIDRELSMQLARVLGQSMAQLATAVVDAGESRSGAVGADTDQSFALRAGALLPFLSDVIDYSFRRHLRAAARRRVVVALADDDVGQVIGFADLVRFTELSMQLDERELAVVVGGFDQVINRVVVRHGGRVVKMIGDGAMFSVLDPAQGAMIALELSAAVAADDRLPGIRVAMASGPVLARDGDVYGPVVNMASRLVTVGRAGAVNVSQELRDALAGDRRFALRSLGDRSLRHIGNVRVYRLRPGPDWATDGAGGR